MITIGLDENNFSPSLAGDCVVCALAFVGEGPEGLKDSKETTLNQRLDLFAKLVDSAVFTIVPASPSDIGHLGIWAARNIAAISAIQCTITKLEALNLQANEIVTDWSFHTVDLGPLPKRCVKGAGRLVSEVAAASIVGKVYVDALFEGYNTYWPGFNLSSNHGSVDSQHKQHLGEVGPCPVHRTRNYGKNWWQLLESV